MIVLNFAHPLTPEHLAAIAGLVSLDPSTVTVRDVPAQFDLDQPFVPQVIALADACALSPAQWQGETLLVNPPSLSAIAVVLAAELHGRMGYFAPLLLLRPVDGPLPRYDVAEIINVQDLRNNARTRRGS